VIAPGYFALATATFLLGDLAAWIDLIAGKPNRSRDQIKLALVGLLLTGLMGFNWFPMRSSSTVMDRWLSVGMIVFALVAFAALILAVVRLHIRLKQPR